MRPPRFLRTARRGFTLLELMFTVGMSAVAFAGLLSLVAANTVFQLRSEQRSLAILLAERVMEETRRRPFAELSETTTVELPFNRNVTQQALIEVRLYDQDGNRLPYGPPIRDYSLIRVEVEVALNALKEDGTPRRNLITRERLVTWMTPPA